jgi:hypothetical protein
VPFLWTDIALKIVKEDIDLATAEDGDGPYGQTALEVLARKTFAIGSESRPSFWKSRLNFGLFATIPNFFICYIYIYIYIYTHTRHSPSSSFITLIPT